MLIKKAYFIILLLSFITMLINFIYFGNLSVDAIFLISNYLVIVICLTLMSYALNKYYHLSYQLFKKKIFWLSLYIRLFSVLFLYLLFYYITGTEFDVEAKDALFYHSAASEVYKSIYSGQFSLLDFLYRYRIGFDDSGYAIFLSFFYMISDGLVILPRLFQALIGAYSVLIILSIGSEFWNEKIGKNASIFAMAFQPMIFLTGLHLKETLMVFFTLLFILYVYRIINYGFTPNRVIIIILTIIVLLSFRTVLAAVAVVALFGYLIINTKAGAIRKVFLSLTILIGSLLLLYNIGVFDEISTKFIAYILVDRESGVTGGRSLEQLFRTGQSLAELVSVPFLIIQSVASPYPSMVKTNISFFDQTLQWYYIGGLFIWNYLSFFAYFGLFISIREKFKQNSILIILLIFYTSALIVSVYILSIRYNVIKLALLIILSGVGMYHFNKRTYRYFILYAIMMTIIIIAWNYVKLGGRGLI